MDRPLRSQLILDLFRLRVAVAYLGERPQCNWWDTTFLNPVGFQYLSLIFPKTPATAALTGAFAGACRSHDERIGRGRVAHLFRLPDGNEEAVCKRQQETTVPELTPFCTVEKAFAVLDEIAAGGRITLQPGPIQIGKLTESIAPSAVRTVAALFAAGFRASQPVFPYLA